ncbi:hypothetical protein BGX29_003846 [Mortierella sp. GBA35]|nr:hypothetical protein BGX29_003846 [Mortierella sp. GBA35]
MPAATASPITPSTQSPARDVYAEIQLQLKRQSQLQAIQQSSRRDSNIGSVSPQIAHTWSVNNSTTSSAIPSSMGSAGHSPFFTPSTLPQTPIGGAAAGGWPQQQPTPVEHQSSLTDITPPAGAFSQESSLTTLDPAPSAVNNFNARLSHPFASSTQQPSYPSAIEQQSSLTEIDGTINSGFTAGNRPYSGGNFLAAAAGGGGNFTGGRPLSNQGQSFNPPYPSAIDHQSSLTEIDSIPSALTEVDNIPSSLTVLDDLPHSLEDQSSLTVVDDLPYGLQEQSSLTEVDNLPHALSEQSPLTEVDEPKKDTLLSLVSGMSNSKDGAIQRKRTSVTPATVTATARASAFSATSAASTTSTATTTTVSPISPAVKALSDANSAAFTMMNWSLPDDFAELATAATEQDKDGDNRVQSPPIANVARAPELSHIDTAWNHNDSEPLTPTANSKPGVTLYTISPNTADESGEQYSPHWKPSSFSAANSINSIRDSTPPVPAKPLSLLQANANRTLNPQSSAAGAELTSDEIQLEPSLPVLQTTLIRPMIEFNIDTEHVDGDDGSHSGGSEEDEDDDGADIVDEIDEFEALLSKNDGVSALIRELQSSMTLSRSGSGSSSIAKAAAGDSDKDSTLSPVKRNDSTSSRTSQRENDPVARMADTSPEETKPKTIPQQQRSVSPPPALVPAESAESYDLPRLATTQFEWTFSEAEQATYERIYSLWERPAEECVSSDIAGKVFMTLGLSSHDLFAIWQMLNPEEKTVLHRTQFIAGLHLVTCKVMGYALPDELPDELMMSAASVGRIVIPPRPAQGPATILPGAVLSEPVDNPQFQQQQQQQQQQQMYGYQSPMSPMAGHAAVPSPPTAYGSNFMHAYDFSSLGGGNTGPIDTTGIFSNSSFNTNEPAPYMDYQQQDQQYYYQQQQQHQQQQQRSPMPNMDNYQQTLAPQPKSASVSKTSSLSRSSKSNSNSNANSAEVVPVTPSKPGPHALHDLAADAPVIMSFESNSTSSSRRPPPVLDSQKATKPAVTSPDASHIATGGGVSNGTTTTITVAPRAPPIDYEKLYASPPDAWDHDAAPPELDVEGNNIKYRSDFKNDMTVSASVTANHPINPKLGVFYFEIVIDHFKGNSALSVGIASKSLRKNFQVGWDLNSWGFHSDDGFLYFGNGKQNIIYSYEYREGDTVGCGVNFLDKAVFFTINGEMMGIAFRFIKESIPLYPAIGLSQAGTEINANFGDQTFLFNIVDYKKNIMAKPNHTQPVMTWNNGAKNDKVFQILADGLSVIARGKDVGCIRGPKVSPRDKDVFYFEIAILYMPPSDLGTITVGVCGKEHSLTDVLGWKPGSYGYSSECGDFLSVSSNRSSLHARSQSGLMKARARGPPFRTGSVVGCGVDFASRELFFTLNGECLGQAFYDLDVLDCFPCVSVIDGGSGVGGPLSILAANGGAAARSKSSGGIGGADRGGFEFKANFGQYPFMFDLVAFETNGGQ